MPKEAEISCKNVFKCEDKSALKKEFNQKWIELINQLEKSKGLFVSLFINAYHKSAPGHKLAEVFATQQLQGLGQTDFVLLNPLCCYLPIVRLFHVLSLDGCSQRPGQLQAVL